MKTIIYLCLRIGPAAKFDPPCGAASAKAAEDAEPAAEPSALKQAVRQARIETAERTSVVVDLRDAELARLELLNEALDPLFAEIPPDVDLFDRGISRGDQPRLWIDVVAHVVMGARQARSTASCRTPAMAARCWPNPPTSREMVEAITHYVANRLVERERALAEDVRRAGGRIAQRHADSCCGAAAGAWCARSCSG